MQSQLNKYVTSLFREKRKHSHPAKLILKSISCLIVLSMSQNVFSGATEIRGGRGGQPFTIACAVGDKIGGFQIQMGKRLDGLGIACIPSNASLNSNPIIDGFTGKRGGKDYRYNVGQSKFVKSITFSACKYKGRTVVRSIKFRYFVVGKGRNARGVSNNYGAPCDATQGKVITHSAPGGQHIYGIIGNSGDAIDSLGVLYRGLPVMGRQQRIPIAGVLKIANNEIFKKTEITLDNFGTYGKNGGYLKNGSTLDVDGFITAFSLPAVSKRRKNGIFRVEYYINDFKSSKIRLTQGNKHRSHLELTADMETNGREVKGFCRKKIGNRYRLCSDNGDVMPDGEIESPRVVMQIVPQVFNGECGDNIVNSIVLTSTASDFQGKVRIAGNWKRVPDGIEKKFKRVIEDEIVNKTLNVGLFNAEKDLNKRLNSSEVQCLIAAPIRNLITNTMGDIRINAVGIDGDNLVVGY